MKRVLQFLGWAAATALLIYLLRRVDMEQLRSAAAIVQWPWIVAALLANAAILLAWTGLWWTATPLTDRVSYERMFEINAIASALMNTVPFLGGHAGAVVLLVKRAGMSRESALSVMALDQLGEGLAKVAIFGFVAAAAPLPDWMRTGIATACIAVGLLLIALLAASHAHIRIRGAGGSSRVARVRVFLAEWARRMDTLRSPRRSVMALAFAVGTKVAEGAGILCVQQALGVELTIAQTSLVLAAVILGSILPVAPGNMGTYETGAFPAYRHLGVDPGMAAILSVGGHACFMIPSVGIGYVIGSWRAGVKRLIAGEI